MAKLQTPKVPFAVLFLEGICCPLKKLGVQTTSPVWAYVYIYNVYSHRKVASSYVVELK